MRTVPKGRNDIIITITHAGSEWGAHVDRGIFSSVYTLHFKIFYICTCKHETFRTTIQRKWKNEKNPIRSNKSFYVLI